MHGVCVTEGHEGEQGEQGKVAVHHHQGECYHLQGGDTALDSSSRQFTAINESSYEIFVKYFWRLDEFRSYTSRRLPIMLQNCFVRAGFSSIFKSG